MAQKIEEKLTILAAALMDYNLDVCANINIEAVIAIKTLRDRIDELGGYHDDI
jgi:hypothetical protein